MAGILSAFVGGLQGGMQSTMSLLDGLEAKQRREQAAKQQALLFNNQQEQYNYDRSVLRPLREREANLRLSDLQGSVDYNAKYRPMQLQESQLRLKDLAGSVGYNEQVRPMQLDETRLRLSDLKGSVDYNAKYRPLQLDAAKNTNQWAEEDRRYLMDYTRPRQQNLDTKADALADYNLGITKENNAYQVQQRNIKQANQLYTAAEQLLVSNPQEAERLIKEADRLSGGIFSNAARGTASKMQQYTQEVLNGQRSMDDPDFVQTAKQYTYPTMINTGRADKYDFAGFDELPDGRIGYKLLPKFGGQYRTEIQQAAQRFELDPRLISAVIGQESLGDKSAVSPKGAQGLMQVMPETAKQVARTIGLSGYDPNNPEHNILVGSAYLKQQLDKYDGNVGLALAAYNAGPGAVDKYKGIPPFKETANYVDKVTGYYKQLRQALPATKNRSSDPNDPLIADTPDQAMSKIQQGVALENALHPRFKEMLLARQLATGSQLPDVSKRSLSLPQLPTGYQWKDASRPELGAMRIPGLDEAGSRSRSSSRPITVSKNDIGVYDPDTGKMTRFDRAESGGALNVPLANFMEDFSTDPEAAKANLIDQRFPELGIQEKANLLDELRDVAKPAEVFGQVDQVRFDMDVTRNAGEWAADLSQGIDPELAKSSPEATRLSQLAEQVKALGWSSEDIKDVAAEVLSKPGIMNNPQAQLQLMEAAVKASTEKKKRQAESQRQAQQAYEEQKRLYEQDFPQFRQWQGER
ncbi:transglycosylase SLT domain-containing protein [Thiolinea disciformis]|uniref:transglycosylase SLT domain-containing protein n=1 Tax=Thiolinea disciformis TaxID=125614 RepID=UPI0003709CA6|nr:transglycosylase SLT domain-containing protein [Thiolinea disciformis]